MTLRPSVDRLYKGYMFDLDGTIYFGSRLLPGAREVVEYLKNAGRRVLFLTNNPLLTREDYADKLTHMGISTTPEQVLSSADILAIHLSGKHAGCSAYVLGEAPLISTLRQSGVQVIEEPVPDQKVDYVVASFDRTFNYEKLNHGMQLLQNGATLIATHADPACPWDGGLIPDAGPIIAALTVCAGKRLDWIAGKPSLLTLGVALAQIGCSSGETLMVGDRLATDIQLGADHGMDTAFVLTGGDTEQDIFNYEFRPTYVLHNLWDILPRAVSAEILEKGASDAR
ncbi:MAG: HAD-IIA family hydrolase [Limnochordia bacterium]|nr:HAD-IIA family hydrolase [Limnochordia bacterium]